MIHSNPTPMKIIREILALSISARKRVIFGDTTKTLDLDQLIAELRLGRSFVRWGDGETAIARGKSIWFQTANEELAKKLNSLIKGIENGPVLGIPTSAIFRPIWVYPSWQHFKIEFSTRIFFASRLPSLSKRNITLSSATIWYQEVLNLKAILELITPLNRPLLVVAGDPKSLEFFSAWEDVSFIRCESKNAFSNFSALSAEISIWVKANKHGTIYCVAGPTSKAIVHDFFQHVQVIDVGHGIMFSINKNSKFVWEESDQDK
jgi:hypothetical protein